MHGLAIRPFNYKTYGWHRPFCNGQNNVQNLTHPYWPETVIMANKFLKFTTLLKLTKE